MQKNIILLAVLGTAIVGWWQYGAYSNCRAFNSALYCFYFIAK